MRVAYALLSEYTGPDTAGMEVTDPTYQRQVEEIEFLNPPPQPTPLTPAMREELVKVCAVTNPNHIVFPVTWQHYVVRGIALYSVTTGEWLRSIPTPQAFPVYPTEHLEALPYSLLFPEVTA